MEGEFIAFRVVGWLVLFAVVVVVVVVVFS